MKIIKRAAAAVTSVVLALGCTAFSYAGGYNTIQITQSQSSKISYNGAEFTAFTGRYSVGGKNYGERAYTVVAKPGIFTSVEVTSGTSVYGKSTLSQKVASYNPGNGRKVVGAINADFFSTATGLPLGIQISNGVVQATNNNAYEKSVGRYSVAFREDGTAFTGIPNLKVSAVIGGSEVVADRLNAYPDANLSMLTDDYADKTYWNTGFAHDIIVLETDGKMRIDKPVSCRFVSYIKSAWEPIAIEKNHIYLIAPAGDTRLSKAAQGKEPGTESSAVVSDLAGGWADVKSAVGGGNLLINGGTLRYPSTYDQSIANTLTSRSAVGIRADGTVIFYTAEKDKNGAQSGGVKLEAVAQALYNMGCVQAVNFDGGGSSTIAASENGGACTVKNSPQDGTQRLISNALLLVCDERLPVVTEDFEGNPDITEQYSGMSLINVQKSNERVYTGTGALKADFKFAGDSSIVGFGFNKPYVLSDYSHMTVSVYGDGSGTELYAVLSGTEGEYKTKLCTLDFTGWKKLEFSVIGASQLRGFHIGTESGSVKAGSIYIDRLTGYKGFTLSDTTAPAFEVSLNGTKITPYANDGAFSSGADYGSLTCTVDGKQIAYTNGAFDISGISGSKIKRAEIEITDIFGNRAKRTLLFKPAGYNSALPYSDVNDQKWDSVYIRYCTENSIIDGFTENGVVTFRGKESITRAQFCTMLVRKMGLDINKYAGVTLPYEDTADIPRWAMLYVKAAYAEGIMTGSKTFTGVSFYARNNITRQEAACAVERIANADERLAMRVEYKDMSDVSGWAKNAVTTLTSKGIFDGDNDGRFYPKRNLSRSESAALITRIV